MDNATPDVPDWIRRLESASSLRIYAASVREHGELTLFAGRGSGGRVLGVAWAGKAPCPVPAGERVSLHGGNETQAVLVPWATAAADWVRELLANSRPQRIDPARPSFGFGERLCRATPGHIAAVRGTAWFPVLAQQSIREMTRTGRTPREVVDDALWGVLVTGFDGSFGADADHLKTPDDIDACADAGFRMFTIDPGGFVDDEGSAADGTDLENRFESLPWQALEDAPADFRARYLERALPGGGPVRDARALARAAVKYGRAVAHTVAMARHVEQRLGRDGFDLEMSVDETANPTTTLEHLYIAAELARLGVRVFSLAPRFVGEFEKGIDYRGNAEQFEQTLRWHGAVANEFGGYRVSFHSGSDKFSVYPIARRVLGDSLHVKTAGTSYLEAVRTIATCEPALFRRLMTVAAARYDTDRATYHVSADAARFPDPDAIAEEKMAELLDDPNARQVFHVTYGSVVGTEPADPELKERFFAALDQDEDAHWDFVEQHLRRHLDALEPDGDA